MCTSLVCKGEAVDFRLVLEGADEKWDGCVEGSESGAAEIKAALQRVDVVSHDAHRLADARKVREEARKRVGRCDHSFVLA